MTRAKERLLNNIATIRSIEELQAFWSALNQEQPEQARDADVIRAKDQRKVEIRCENIQAAEQASHRRKPEKENQQ